MPSEPESPAIPESDPPPTTPVTDTDKPKGDREREVKSKKRR